MSTTIHTIETATKTGVVVTTTVIETYPQCYVVRCDGGSVGHECSDVEDVLVESGDTWELDTNAVEFAELHAIDHRDRPAPGLPAAGLSIADIALMRQLIAWRKEVGVEIRPERGAWVDMTKPFRGGQRWITRDMAASDSGEPEVGFGSDYATSPATWIRVSSLTEAVDILVAKGYVPARFSSAYLAGWDAVTKVLMQPVSKNGTRDAFDLAPATYRR
jgi:hypothetical protein